MKSLTLGDPRKLKRRPDGCAPYSHLKIQSKVACELCDYRSTNASRVRRYQVKVHSCKKSRKDWLRNGIRDNIKLQCWTQNGEKEYWIVRFENGLSAIRVVQNTECSPRCLKSVAELHKAENERLVEKDKIRSITNTRTHNLALTSN